MTYKSLRAITISLTAGALLTMGMLPGLSFGAVTAGHTNSSSTRQAARMANLVKRGGREIDRRVANLNKISARIGEMKKLSSSEIASLSSSIQDEINNLTTLKTKIDSDTDLATLLADVQSIAKSYRIYMLVIPRTAIVAAADRIMTTVDAMNAVGAKLQTRLTSAQSNGKNLSALETALTDFNAKVTDANTQAQAAVSEASILTPDNGNQTQMQANTAALKDARSKIKSARQDLVAARKDAGTIVKGLRVLGGGPTPAATSTGQ